MAGAGSDNYPVEFRAHVAGLAPRYPAQIGEPAPMRKLHEACAPSGRGRLCRRPAACQGTVADPIAPRSAMGPSRAGRTSHRQVRRPQAMDPARLEFGGGDTHAGGQQLGLAVPLALRLRRCPQLRDRGGAPRRRGGVQRPLFHKPPAFLEVVAPEICSLDAISISMRQCRFGNLARE